MGKRKVLDIFLLIGGIVLLILALAGFIVSIINGQIFGAVFSLFHSLIMIVLIVRVLLLARDAHDSDKTILDKSDLDKLKDKMK